MSGATESEIAGSSAGVLTADRNCYRMPRDHCARGVTSGRGENRPRAGNRHGCCGEARCAPERDDSVDLDAHLEPWRWRHQSLHDHRIRFDGRPGRRRGDLECNAPRGGEERGIAPATGRQGLHAPPVDRAGGEGRVVNVVRSEDVPLKAATRARRRRGVFRKRARVGGNRDPVSGRALDGRPGERGALGGNGAAVRRRERPRRGQARTRRWI